MKLIIDGDYQKELVPLINKENIPVTHIIVHVPQNPFGNSSIFLPEILPSFKQFEEYTRVIQDHGITPIAGIDSTCQGNLEAHSQHYQAINSLVEKLHQMEYSNILVSAPNIIGFIKAKFPSMKLLLSYSQYVTSLNRGKMFLDLGVDSLILHPDIIRYSHVLKNFNIFRETQSKSRAIDFVLPLNLGCNWGCIHWYQHHNLQSHRTINSPVFSQQQTVSNVKNEFDYPLLYCWKKRLEDPVNILKAGWISPEDVGIYEELGYETFLLLTSGFPIKKVLKILQSYSQKSLDISFNDVLNIPQPYGNYWTKEEINNSLIQLKPEVIKEFSKNSPYQEYYPFEKEINKHCNNYLGRFQIGNPQQKDRILKLIEKEMKKIEAGAIRG